MITKSNCHHADIAITLNAFLIRHHSVVGIVQLWPDLRNRQTLTLYNGI